MTRGGVGGGHGQVPQNLRGVAHLVHSRVLSSIISIVMVLISIAVVLSSIVTIIMVPNSWVQVNAPCLL